MKWIAEALKKMDGVQVHGVHPNDVKWITESRGKTDRVEAKKLAELARAGLLPRAVHVVEGSVRELRELVSARQPLQSKRVALINTIRGYVDQEGHRLPAKFFTGPTWRVQVARLPVSVPLRLIIHVKTEVGCPPITDVRCPLFADAIVRSSCSDRGIGSHLLSGRG